MAVLKMIRFFVNILANFLVADLVPVSEVVGMAVDRVGC